MSEYQYYEFQAIDRPLTPGEQQAVSRLSSRVDPHPRRATFVYNYSDFPGQAKDVLAKYYDALFYISNWGSVQLAFRFPRALLDPAQVEPYCVPGHVTCEVVGEFVVVDIEKDWEEGFDYWIEGEGTLDTLIPLREAIIQQDYRLLYLAWLSAIGDEWEVDEDDREPPLPAGLQNLSGPLEEFVDLFGIDEHLLDVAASASQEPQAIDEAELRQAIARLLPEEHKEWLLRLAQNEANLAPVFQRHLLGSAAAPSAQGRRRTVGELLELAEEEEILASQRARVEAEARRIRELEALAPKAEETWALAEQLIAEGKARAYDEAVQLLLKLHALAIHQGAEAAYEQRLHRIREHHHRRRALLQRLDRAGLP